MGRRSATQRKRTDGEVEGGLKRTARMLTTTRLRGAQRARASRIRASGRRPAKETLRLSRLKASDGGYGWARCAQQITQFLSQC